MKNKEVSGCSCVLEGTGMCCDSVTGWFAVATLLPEGSKSDKPWRQHRHTRLYELQRNKLKVMSWLGVRKDGEVMAVPWGNDEYCVVFVERLSLEELFTGIILCTCESS